MHHTTRFAIASLFMAGIAGCSSGTASQDQPPVDAAPAPAEAAPAPAPSDTAPPPAADAAPPAPTQTVDAPAFAGKTWKVTESDAVQAGTTYTFNADGSLVIASGPGNPPGTGKWTYTDGKLVIEEEGQSYPTDIERLDAEHFDIRSHNPGGTVSIKMVPAAP